MGKGPSGKDYQWTNEQIRVGLNHAAAWIPNCTFAVAADMCMLPWYEEHLGLETKVVKSKRCRFPRHRHEYIERYPEVSSGAMAINFLADLGVSSITLIGFDALKDPASKKYKHCNTSIIQALEANCINGEQYVPSN